MNIVAKIISRFKDFELPKYNAGTSTHNYTFKNKSRQVFLPNSKFHKRLFKNQLSETNISTQQNIHNHFMNCIHYIDVGANLGYFSESVFAAKGYKSAFLFEPCSYNFNILSKNHVNKPNFKLFQLGLSDTPGTGSLSMPLKSYPSNWYKKLNNTGLMSLHGEGSYRKEEIKLEVFDELAKKENIPTNNTFIKIDIEGHEIYALRGMKSLLSGEKNIFQIEVNLIIGKENVGPLFKLFGDNNYSSFRYHSNSNSFEEVTIKELNNVAEDIFFWKKS